MSFEVLKDYWGAKSNFKTPSYMNKKWSEIHPCIQFLIK
ncbi:hypothetical protein AsAng_0014250 [Aureispira anguillae]|uniref:Uncharacterized protein n=1 Tax=Aureispira anguillae TaxID=2864201 RepID=A0A916DQH3_9BACT|nr:hypothetical protein AsAng_0014250 [Aureispira anguillae]